MNIRLPERIQLSPYLKSRPIAPLGYPPLQNQQVVTVVPQASYINHQPIQNNYLGPATVPRIVYNQMPMSPVQHHQSISIFNNKPLESSQRLHSPGKIYQQRSQSPVILRSNIQTEQKPNGSINRINSRPQSPQPKVEFKYVSPSKHNKLPEIKEASVEASINVNNSLQSPIHQLNKNSMIQNGHNAQQAHTLHGQGLFSQLKSIPELVSTNIVNENRRQQHQYQLADSSHKKQNNLPNKNSISNYIYLVQNQNEDVNGDQNKEQNLRQWPDQQSIHYNHNNQIKFKNQPEYKKEVAQSNVNSDESNRDATKLSNQRYGIKNKIQFVQSTDYNQHKQQEYPIPKQKKEQNNEIEQAKNQKSNDNFDRFPFYLQQRSSQQLYRQKNSKNVVDSDNNRLVIDEQQVPASKSKLKTHDQELKQMIAQYESLKYISNQNNTNNYPYSYGDSDNKFPRVQKNSSEEASQQSSRRNSKLSDRATGSRVKNNQENRLKGTLGHLNEQSQNNLQNSQSKNNDHAIRFNETQSSLKKKIVNKKQQNPKTLIRQQSQFVIDGVENVRSEVLDGQIPTNQTLQNNLMRKRKKDIISGSFADDKQQQYEHEDLANMAIKMREKDLQIKNLKNQVWLMRMRQNQLLSMVKKLQQVNKDQLGLIQKMRKK